MLELLIGIIIGVIAFLLKPFFDAFKDQHDLPFAVPGRLPPDPTVFPFYMQNKQNIWLYWRRWLPLNQPVVKARAVVFLVQGLCEHGARYDGAAQHLTQQGYAVFACDHQGQGNSEGDRIFVNKFTDFVDDAEQFVKHVFHAHPELAGHPRFVFGHSMGGLIATHLTMRNPKYWSGVILSGPALEADPKVATPFLKTVSRLLSSVCPKLGIDKLKIPDLSRNEQIVQLAYQDFCYPKGLMRARWAAQMLDAMDFVFENAAQKDKTCYNALFVMHGAEDKICFVGGSRRFVEVARCEKKKLVEYAGRPHELLADTQRADILGDLVSFIDANLRQA